VVHELPKPNAGNRGFQRLPDAQQEFATIPDGRIGHDREDGIYRPGEGLLSTEF